MLDNEDISRFNFKGRKFYFSTSWKADSFAVEATDGRQLWIGTATKQQIKESLCPKNMSILEYVSIVRQV